MDNTIGTLSQLDPSLLNPTQSVEKPDDVVDQQEFMNLLVTQLKNQDPLNPMEQEEFAVQLAQFTQVEQLVKMNEKLDALDGGGGGGQLSSLASYLGNEVWLNSDQVEVKAGNGGEVAFSLATNTAEVSIELLDEAGNVQEVANIGPLPKGDHRVPLENLNVTSGTYTARVKADTGVGTTFEPKLSIAGIISGFIPGETPTLLLGDKEISSADIGRVQVPS